jgi:glycosyltransferase involved in cell wall biosynthesis
MTEEPKIRVLALGDYACTTGFATVMSNIMRQLEATGKYQLDIIGINYTGDPYDKELFPGNVWPALNIANMNGGDPYGRQKFLDMLGSGDYDVAFVLTDTFIMQTFVEAVVQTNAALPKKFKLVYYFPIDADPKKEWVQKCVSLVDFPVVYTEYGKRLVLDIDPTLANRLKVIYHGTNLEEFQVVEDKQQVADFRKRYFAGRADGKFLITNVNRNQVRKDPMRNFMVLNELRRRGRDDAVLYLHMSHDDAGGNILVMADHFGFKLQEDYILPSPKFFNENRGIPVEALNLIYNCSDALFTPTLGEGWGLSLTEAMATKLPIVAPENTSVAEILADNRGFLAKSGSNPSLWTTLGSGDNERMRPLLDVEDAATQLEKIMDGILPDIDKAYAWARQYNWQSICQEWANVFDIAAHEARLATQVGVARPNRAQRRKVKSKNRK